jgi:hypothetical protein
MFTSKLPNLQIVPNSAANPRGLSGHSHWVNAAQRGLARFISESKESDVLQGGVFWTINSPRIERGVADK